MRFLVVLLFQEEFKILLIDPRLIRVAVKPPLVGLSGQRLGKRVSFQERKNASEDSPGLLLGRGQQRIGLRGAVPGGGKQGLDFVARLQSAVIEIRQRPQAGRPVLRELGVFLPIGLRSRKVELPFGLQRSQRVEVGSPRRFNQPARQRLPGVL